MKPKIIVWISAGNFTKKQANAMIDAGIVPMFHIGQNEPGLVEKFLDYKRPSNYPIIWSTQLFNKMDMMAEITKPGVLAERIKAARLSCSAPRYQCLDLEPLDGSAMEVYRQMPMMPMDYLAIYHAIRPYLKTFDYVIPSDPRQMMLYNVLRGLGVREITQTTPQTLSTPNPQGKRVLPGRLSMRSVRQPFLVPDCPAGMPLLSK